MKLGLAQKIGLFTAMSFIATGIITGAVFYYGIGTYLVDKELDTFGDLLYEDARYIRSIIDATRSDVAFLTATPPIQGIIRAHKSAGLDPLDGSTKKQWTNRLSIIFTELLRAKNSYLQIRFIGLENNGLEIVRVEKSAGKIKTIAKQYLQSQGNESYFRELIKRIPERIHISRIELNREHGKISLPHIPVARIATTISDELGAIFGILILNVDINQALFSAFEKDLTKHSQYFITNADGDYLLHPNVSRRFGFDLGERHLIQYDYPELAGYFENHEQMAPAHFVSSDDFGNKKDVFYFRKVFFDDHDLSRFFGITIIESYENIIASATKARQQLIFWMAIMILLVSVFAYYLTRHQLNGLIALTQATRDFSLGKSKLNIPQRGDDEIGLLAQALNDMVSKFSAHEKSLADSEQRYRYLVETSPNTIITYDQNGEVLFVNNDGIHLLGGSNAGNIVGRCIKRFIKLDDDLFSKGSRNREHQLICLNGRVIDVEVSGATFSYQNRSVYQIIVHDISERKRTEHELKIYRDKLQELVDIQTDELILARDEALAGERAMSGFLANMSHELRTPLHGIMSFSNFGLSKIDTASKQKLVQYFTEIHDSGEQLLALVNDLLDLAKLRAGKMDFQYESIIPVQVVKNATKMLSVLANEKKIRIVVDDDKQQIPMMMDRVKFGQVIKNLLSNAIKFSPIESIIEVNIRYIDALGSLEITVSDQGVGVPETEVEHIFEVFSQSTTTKTMAGGTGLGLPICREIIEAGHNGSIKAVNRKGGGTIFIVQIPIVVDLSNVAAI